MKGNTYLWLGVGVVIALVLAAGVLFLWPRAAAAPANTTGAAASGATTTSSLFGSGVSVQASGGVTVKEVPVNSGGGATAPNLNYQVAYSSSLAPDAVAALKAQIAMLVGDLKKDPTQFGNWLQLAIDYKIAGDYTAAANVWLYLTQEYSGSYIAFADLGDLYQNFDVNYPKAETNYLEAIKLMPSDIDLYRDLYTMYRYQYKTGTSAAANIVAQGLKANPGNPDLLQMQQALQASAQ